MRGPPAAAMAAATCEPHQSPASRAGRIGRENDPLGSVPTRFSADRERTPMATATGQPLLRSETTQKGIVTLHLGGGDRSVVVLDAALLHQLDAALDAIFATPPTGLVIASDCPRTFIAGADLAEINELDDHAIHAYLAYGTTVLGRISQLPCPTVAAIDGAALGGGLELALHCDGIVLSRQSVAGKPYAIGLPEASLGLCPGWGGTQTLPARIDPQVAICATATGTTFHSGDVPDGLAVSIVEDPSDLPEAALSFLQTCTAADRAVPRCIDAACAQAVARGSQLAREEVEATDAAEAVFAAVDVGCSQGWTAAVAAEQCALVRLRSTETARERLEAFFARG